MNKKEAALQEKLGLSDKTIFLPEEKLTLQYVEQHSKHDLHLATEQNVFIDLAEKIKAKARAIDATLEASATAAMTKVEHQLEQLEKKMLRAEKRNMEDKTRQVEQFKTVVFPNHSLQERYDSFLSYYIAYGDLFFRELFNNTLPLGNQFLILKEQ